MRLFPDLYHRLLFYFAILLYCIISFLCSLCPANGSETVDRIVAVVNDEIITLYDLNLAIKPYIRRIKFSGYPPEKERELLYTVRENMLKQLIEELLTDQELKKYDIEISEEEVDKTIERVKEANLYTDEELRKVLAEDGLTMERYRQSLKKQLLRARIIDFEVKSKVIITKEDVQEYYNKHLDKYGQKIKYHLRNIIKKVPNSADYETKKNILKTIEAIHAKLIQGESFEEMARKYSESPFAAQGGDIGLFEFKDLSLTIQEALKGKKEGEFTNVIDTDHGYQIFYIEGIVKTKGKPIEEVTPEIEDIIYTNRVDDRFQEWIESIKKTSHIKIIK